MNRDFNLEEYLTGGVEQIVKNAVKATLKNPKESIFMAKYAIASKEAAAKRKAAESRGEHIPPFLIASITSSCNLHCAGCYSRANHACHDDAPQSQMTQQEWKRVFQESEELGIGFILLAGGEPLVRMDVIETAATFPKILFPVFTNGTMFHDAYFDLFHKNRNLVPVFSVEGMEPSTDERRGPGVYQSVMQAMERMNQKGIVFGVSVTVTRQNLKEVTTSAFLDHLEAAGCKVVFFIEYVPVTDESRELAPEDADRAYLKEALDNIRMEEERNLLCISFPGDEKTSGGCLAAGRGFFHINSQGGAEPCPFSPYSDRNVRTSSIREVLQSRLFTELGRQNILMEDHAGGCVLFEREDQVQAILNQQ